MSMSNIVQNDNTSAYQSVWSAYSDHILEEGEVVTRAMQRKFAREAKAIEEDTGDMR